MDEQVPSEGKDHGLQVSGDDPWVLLCTGDEEEHTQEEVGFVGQQCSPPRNEERNKRRTGGVKGSSEGSIRSFSGAAGGR